MRCAGFRGNEQVWLEGHSSPAGRGHGFGRARVGIYHAPDNEQHIESRLRELVAAGAYLLITTGGMSVDPDDVTRFAIRSPGATGVVYGSAVLPAAMVLVRYLPNGKCGV